MKHSSAFPEISARAMGLYLAYIEFFGNPDNVYYPGCGNDATPGTVFLESNVVFLDVEDWEDVIRRQIPNAKVIHLPAEKFVSDVTFDLVINMNSHVPFFSQIKDLKKGGHLIITNKMSESAFSHPLLNLVGVVEEMHDSGGNYKASKLITTDLGKFKVEKKDDNPFSNNRKIKVPYYIFQK